MGRVKCFLERCTSSTDLIIQAYRLLGTANGLLLTCGGNVDNYRVLMSICVSVCLCVCVHDNSKNNGSINLKLEHTVVYENSSDEFNIGHCPITSSWRDFEIFLHIPQYKLSSPISQLWHMLESCDKVGLLIR